jgi:hypothetical protein
MGALWIEKVYSEIYGIFQHPNSRDLLRPRVLTI